MASLLLLNTSIKSVDSLHLKLLTLNIICVYVYMLMNNIPREPNNA